MRKINSPYRDIVGVTGSIGSGKSTVSKILQSLGATVVSADNLAAVAVKKGSPGLHAVVKQFGPDILQANGELNRRRLGSIVFNDKEKKSLLESIIHPEVRLLAASEFEQARKSKAPLIVYDCPLLVEAGLIDEGFSKVVLVTAPEADCIRRVMERDGLSEKEIQARVKAQMPVSEKERFADILIENSGSLEELTDKVICIYKRLTLAVREPAS